MDSRRFQLSLYFLCRQDTAYVTAICNPPHLLNVFTSPARLQLAVKSFPKKADGSKGTAEAGGRIEKGDFLVAVNSIRLEGFAFADAIKVLMSQVRAAFPAPSDFVVVVAVVVMCSSQCTWLGRCVLAALVFCLFAVSWLLLLLLLVLRSVGSREKLLVRMEGGRTATTGSYADDK